MNKYEDGIYKHKSLGLQNWSIRIAILITIVYLKQNEKKLRLIFSKIFHFIVITFL